MKYRNALRLKNNLNLKHHINRVKQQYLTLLSFIVRELHYKHHV